MSTAVPEKPIAASVRMSREIEPLGEHDAQLVNVARRCLMAALDHSRAQRIMVLSEDQPTDSDPVVVIPAAALKVVARVLELMGERKPITLIPRDHELTTQEVANMLNVSRPFIVKEIERGNLDCYMVGAHRRVPYKEVIRYRDEMKATQEEAMQELADQAQELGLGYE
jgi:excisionase family DNA binding protein